MPQPLDFILRSVVIGILVALPAALIELWLIKLGVVRNRMVVLVLGILTIVFIKRILFYELSWGIIAPMIVLLGILGINRGDFWTTMSRGRWWWKSDKYRPVVSD